MVYACAKSRGRALLESILHCPEALEKSSFFEILPYG